MIRLQLASPVPLEQQIYEQLRHGIASGQVTPGQPLPSVRQLAGDLGVHWNTVARAYRRLGEEGLASIRHGRGAVVGGTEHGRKPSVRDSVRAKLREALTEAHLAGLPLEAVRLWFQEQAAAFPFRKDRA